MNMFSFWCQLVVTPFVQDCLRHVLPKKPSSVVCICCEGGCLLRTGSRIGSKVGTGLLECGCPCWRITFEKITLRFEQFAICADAAHAAVEQHRAPYNCRTSSAKPSRESHAETSGVRLDAPKHLVVVSIAGVSYRVIPVQYCTVEIGTFSCCCCSYSYICLPWVTPFKSGGGWILPKLAGRTDVVAETGCADLLV